MKIKKVIHFTEDHAGWLLLTGVSLAAIYNAIRWPRDLQRVQEIKYDSVVEPEFQDQPLVSILLPAWNEAHNLADCVQSILELRYPNIELVICAGGVDGTLDIARSYTGERIIVMEQRPGERKQGALRKSFAHSTGEIIYLTDADCILDDGTFESTLAPLIVDGEIASTGSWRPLDHQAHQSFVKHQWSHHLYRELWMPGYAPTLDGRNAAIRREILEQVDAFLVEALIGTDYVLSKQLTTAGYSIRFVRGCRVQTEYPAAVPAYWRQQSRWFRNPIVLGRQWGESDLLIGHLRAGISSFFMLVVPLVAGLRRKTMRGKPLWSLWFPALAHLIFTQFRLQQTSHAYTTTMIYNRLDRITAIPFMILGWLVMAASLLEFLLPVNRRRW